MVLILVMGLCVCIAEELPDVYKQVFVENQAGDMIAIGETAAIRVKDVQWTTYKEYCSANNIQQAYGYTGHCTVLTLEVTNTGKEELKGKTMLDNSKFVYFGEPNKKEEETGGGEWIGWIDWDNQYTPRLAQFIDPQINQVEATKINGNEYDGVLLEDISMNPGDVVEVVALYSSWEAKAERERITAIQIIEGGSTYMVSVNAPCYMFSDPDQVFSEDELPTLLSPLAEIGIDYLSMDARIEYFGGSYYGDERQLYCDAVKEFQRLCGLDETGNYDLQTRMWLNHKRINQ